MRPHGAGHVVYTSRDAGETWAPQAGPQLYLSVASSADGMRLLAVGWGHFDGNNNWIYGGLHRSTDGGATWQRTSARDEAWYCVASSADGQTLAAASLQDNVVFGARGSITVSRDGGDTWARASAPAAEWISVATSLDAATMVAAASEGLIYVSRDSGTTWTSRWKGAYRDWMTVSCTGDGKRMIAVPQLGPVSFSGDFGETWIESADGKFWPSSTAAGMDFFVADLGYHIGKFEFWLEPPPKLNMTFAGQETILSWTTNSAGYQLKMSADLNSPYWFGIEPEAQVNGTNYETRISIFPGEGRYFYLRHP